MSTDRCHEVASWMNSDGTRGFKMACGEIYDAIEPADPVKNNFVDLNVAKVRAGHICRVRTATGSFDMLYWVLGPREQDPQEFVAFVGPILDREHAERLATAVKGYVVGISIMLCVDRRVPAVR